MRAVIQHHKKLSLEMQDGDWLEHDDQHSAADAATVAPLVPAAPVRTSSRQGHRISSRRRSSSIEQLDVMERQERRLADPSETMTGTLTVDGRESRVSLTATGMEWTCTSGGCLEAASTISETLPFSEMLAVQTLEPGRAGLGMWPAAKVHRLAIFTLRRSRQRRCDWGPRRIVLESGSQDVARDWCTALASGIDAVAAGRPRSLLVVLNPNAGHRRSLVVYKRIVEPVFAAAGVKVTVLETQWSGHAAAMLREMRLEELCSYDGVVGVGGDGVFHELMNGLLAVRSVHGGTPPDALLALRLAHIPAGSTDAVACTFHGTRSVFTAAMHIALGDRTSLDVLRLDTLSGATIFSSCMASYGFMGDVMASSEAWRFLGPVRYDLVGTLKLLACRAYPARVSYIRGSYMAAALSAHRHKPCGTNCEVCRAAGHASARRLSDRLGSLTQQLGGTSSPTAAQRRHLPRPPSSAASESGESLDGSEGWRPASPAVAGAAPTSPSAHVQFLHPSTTAAQRHEEEWVELEGEFVSIMMLNMPCISEKTRSGIVRSAHLADGTIKLVLVRKCNPLQYLRFLVAMTNGLTQGQQGYVEVIDAVAVRVECPQDRPASHWNLDGELLRSSSISAEIHQGVIQVFARGVER